MFVPHVLFMYQYCILQNYSIVLVSSRKISPVFFVFLFPGDGSSPKQHRTGDAARVNTHSAAASGLITTFSKSSILIIKKSYIWKTKQKLPLIWKLKSRGCSFLIGKGANVQKVGRKQVCWMNSDLLDIHLLSHRIHMQHQRAVQGVAALGGAPSLSCSSVFRLSTWIWNHSKLNGIMKTSPRVPLNHFALCTAKRGKTQHCAKTAETLVEITPLFLLLLLLLELDFL